MFRRVIFFFACIVAASVLQGQTSIAGQIKDKETGEPVINASIKVLKGQNMIVGTISDFDGNYSIQVDPGTYSVEVSYTGYNSRRIDNVRALGGKVNVLNVILVNGLELDPITISVNRIPIIEIDKTTTDQTITSEDIAKLGSRSINAIAATSAGVSSIDGGDLNIRGGRTDATVYYLDGIRFTGRPPSSSDIEQIQIIKGGIEPQYGDVTGGVISLTSKGPASELSGGIEGETSQYLDPYGYSFINANLSGPLYKKGNRSVLGFRLSGQYTYQKDDDPPAFGEYFAKQSTIDRLVKDPIILFKGDPAVNGAFIENNEVDFSKYNKNDQNKALDFTGKLDIRPSENVDVTLSGTYANVTDRFVPTDNIIGTGSWRLFNWDHNPMSDVTTYRGNLRFRHRLGKIVDVSQKESGEGTESKKASPIQNATYTLQFGYQNTKGKTEDIVHKDNFFDYGYVGSFDRRWEPIFDQQDVHVGYVDLVRSFTSGDKNPTFAHYNDQPNLTPQVLDSYRAYNSFISSSFHNVWSGVHTNAGSVYNRYNKTDDDITTLQGSFGFDFLPGGSKNGRHNIQLGLVIEQRVNRNWTILPYELWKFGRLYQNDHITGIDSTCIAGVDSLGRLIYCTLTIPKEGSKFYKSIRGVLFPNDSLSNSIHKYANIDQLRPDQLSLDMFSASELTDQSALGFSGYDYLGNKLARGVKFEDFFQRDANGNQNFSVAPFSPIYAAGYLQDKFVFKDIIFRIGTRVDYYDANTKVLKDPYSLHGILGAKAFHEQKGSVKPGSIGDDYKVYLTEAGSPDVKAYRNNDQWYFANGTPANSSILIFGENNLVSPAYIQPVDSLRTIRGKYFKVDESFEDYKPQVNWMPRIAFSFPISDNANFFSHYDVLVQRPTSNSYVSPLSYYYFDIQGRTPEQNGNLKPSRKVDYEVGFQQKLSDNSALSISAYYNELRNMIAYSTLSKIATVGTYNTYTNIDFGTVKGFNFSYDLRRINNFEFTAAYTLQFADGTGSDPDSQKGLTGKGINIRNIFAFTYDERHRLSFTGDYRYGSGKQYNGPRIGGVNILANTGINMLVTTASGRPYTPGLTIVRYDGAGYRGDINGGRLPWNFNIDLKADKSFTISKPEAKHPMNVNIYLRVQNLLDTRNVIGLYRGSEDPADDGYLASGRGQIEKGSTSTTYGEENLHYFIDSYNYALLNPDNYTLPRRIFLGIVLGF